MGIVARLEAIKDHRTLLRAIAAVSSKVHLAVVGDGSLRPALETLVEDLGIRDRVSFLGEVPAGAGLQHAFDLVALSSLDEGFPNAIVEGMAAGRPVVATAVGGVVDAVTDDDTGLLVPAGDVTALAAALERLCDDRALRLRLGARAREVARERYSRGAVIDLISNSYMKFVRTNRGLAANA